MECFAELAPGALALDAEGEVNRSLRRAVGAELEQSVAFGEVDVQRADSDRELDARFSSLGRVHRSYSCFGRWLDKGIISKRSKGTLLNDAGDLAHRAGNVSVVDHMVFRPATGVDHYGHVGNRAPVFDQITVLDAERIFRPLRRERFVWMVVL